MTKDFYNFSTKRFNNYKSAKKNGLFEHPENFQLPANTGLDLLNKRSVSLKLLNKKIKNGIIPAGLFELVAGASTLLAVGFEQPKFRQCIEVTASSVV